jgi:ribosomal protein S18 acetylase RimI-like enzyme
MTIRKMTIEDYDGVYALWLSCEGLGLNKTNDSREGIGRFLKRNPDTCFIAEEENEIIGCIMAGHDGRRGYIYHTAVSPDHQHKGIGSALVEAAVKALKNEGISKAALLVFAHNEKGNAFWEKQGFTLRTDVNYRNRHLTEMHYL